MNERARQLRTRYLRAMNSSGHIDELIVLWRRWRFEVGQG